MRLVAAALAALCGVLSVVGAVLFGAQAHATRLFVRKMETSADGGLPGISYTRVNTFGGIWLLIVLIVIAVIVTLIAVQGLRLWRSPSALGALALLISTVVLDYGALSTTPGGFGTEFPHNASGRDAQFDSWGGDALQRGAWLAAIAAVAAVIAGVLILFRVKSTDRTPAMYAYPGSPAHAAPFDDLG